MGYITNFAVYVLAMLGVIMIALFVFKSTTGCKIKHSGNGKGLKVTDTLSLGARKTLYVVEAGGERFLIAGDIDRTSLISKLQSEETHRMQTPAILKDGEFNTYRDIKTSTKESYMDKSVVGITSSKTSPYESVIKSLAEKIHE